jgi:perosamine synthetase
MKKGDLLALFGGAPVNATPLPPYNTIGEAEKAAVLQVLETGVLSGFAAQPNNDHLGGDVVTGLEAAFCETFGSKYAVALNSATSGLHAAVAAMGVGPGDEVIVPPYTMTASATAILYTGALPVFADIDDEIFCLDPACVEDAITPRTKGIMAVNLYGHPAPLRELRAIADRHGLFLIEDNAQSALATIDGQYAGTVGDCGIFSLNRHKTLQCGEGGVVITDDARIAERVRLVRNHGEVLVDAMGVDDIANMVGMNYRIPNMEAAVATVQISRVEELTAPRIHLAGELRKALSGIEGITTPVVRDNCTHVYYFFTMKYDAEVTGLPRDLFAEAVRAEGYHMAAGYVKPIYLEPLYQRQICFGANGFPFSSQPDNSRISYDRGICPVVERLQDKDLIWTNITYPPLTDADMKGFAEACDKVIRNRDVLLEKRSQDTAK